MSGRKPEGLLMIGELARQADVSLTTVKYYVREGLIQPACRTGRNMAYYDPSAVEVIGLIRKLQRERYYPLSVIKRMLSGPDADAPELALLNAIHKVDGTADESRCTATEAGRRTGLSPQQVGALHAAGLVTPEVRGRKNLYGAEDLEIMRLIRQRLDAGIPFEQSLEAFRLYGSALEAAVRADVDSFTAAAMVVPDFDAEAAARRIRVSDETLDRFVSLRRRALNRQYGSRRVEDLARYAAVLDEALRALPPLLERHGLADAADQCRAAADGDCGRWPVLRRVAGRYRSLERSRSDVSASIAACVDSRSYFTAFQADGALGSQLPAWCLKLAWLTLAPEILDCGRAAADAWARFRRLDLPAGLADDLAALLQRREESA